MHFEHTLGEVVVPQAVEVHRQVSFRSFDVPGRSSARPALVCFSCFLGSCKEGSEGFVRPSSCGYGPEAPMAC
jgi:hypothetical protein